jgi:hypothetical protein
MLTVMNAYKKIHALALLRRSGRRVESCGAADDLHLFSWKTRDCGRLSGVI